MKGGMVMTLKEKKNKAIALYNSGYTTGEIAKLLDVNEVDVVRWLRLD